MSYTRLKIRLIARLVDGAGSNKLDRIAAMLHGNDALFNKCIKDGLDYAAAFLKYKGRFKVRFEPEEEE
ncbi:hypothetical protein KKF29_03960 [Patescibacteria group bacterium]|nr:hypothetical protein [Patescibacteria group bacterium]